MFFNSSREESLVSKITATITFYIQLAYPNLSTLEPCLSTMLHQAHSL